MLSAERLLIVEDEPSLGQQLRNTLEGAGYAVDLADDGEDGHFLGATESYDAVVLDLGLPTIDGLTVLDRWRKEGRSFPVLVLTARDSWSDKVAGLDAGADDYLAKPFQSEELIARLQAMKPADDLYDAHFTVLGEYTNHHITEEEDELFKKVIDKDIDLRELEEPMQDTRRQALSAKPQG